MDVECGLELSVTETCLPAALKGKVLLCTLEKDGANSTPFQFFITLHSVISTPVVFTAAWKGS